MSDTANKEIRELIKKRRLRYYEVAEAIGITQYTFSVWLRNELSQEKKEKILKAINDYQI